MTHDVTGATNHNTTPSRLSSPPIPRGPKNEQISEFHLRARAGISYAPRIQINARLLAPSIYLASRASLMPRRRISPWNRFCLFTRSSHRKRGRASPHLPESAPRQDQRKRQRSCAKSSRNERKIHRFRRLARRVPRVEDPRLLYLTLRVGR